MADITILRIPRSDSSGDFALIKVSKVGDSNLDLKLVGTEGEKPYVGSLRTDKIHKLRAKAFRGDDQEWTDILTHAFKQGREDPVSPESVLGLEITASVKSNDEGDDGSQLSISLRKRIGGITQKLGSVTLNQDDDQEIELFDWAGRAASRADALDEQISSLRLKYQDAETTIKQLSTQLDELIVAKNEHDEQLIGKFAQLLNEKKLKIRNQQRLLVAAQVDPTKVVELEEEAAKSSSRKPDASRRSKRKAAGEDSDIEDGFDAMEVDDRDNKEDGRDDLESEAPSTPEPLEEETASETEDHDLHDAKSREKSAHPAIAQGGGKRSTSAALGERNIEDTGSGAASSNPSEPPPRRNLPFGRKAKAAQTKLVESGGADESTTDDDEL